MNTPERDEDTRFDETQRRVEMGLISGEYIDSKRTLSLFDGIWERLPELDRHILREASIAITDSPGAVRDSSDIYGCAGGFMGEVLIDGVGCMLPEDARVYLNTEGLARLSDLAASAVIAHELAHVILRHHCMSHPLALIGDLRCDELDKTKEVHEWAADLQVWLWGFTAEMRCLWDENEQEPPPWYHQIEP